MLFYYYCYFMIDLLPWDDNKQSQGIHYSKGGTEREFCRGLFKKVPSKLNGFLFYLDLILTYICLYFRLLNPNVCNVNESHSDSCPCHSDIYKESGGSYFSKIRLDLSTMIIDGKTTPGIPVYRNIALILSLCFYSWWFRVCGDKRQQIPVIRYCRRLLQHG